MKNLRGSVLTVMVAILASAFGDWVDGQQLPPPSAGGIAAPDAYPQAVGPGLMAPPPGLPAIPQYAPGGPAAIPQTQIPLAAANFAALPAAQPTFGPTMQAGPPGPIPMSAPAGMYPASYGPPEPFPASPAMPMQAGYQVGYEGEYGGCASCGGAGCGNCLGIGGGALARAVSRLLPYGEGGPCAPRWYDIMLDGMYLKRDTATRSIAFSSDGPSAAPVDVLLSTDDLNFSEELGFRFTGSVQAFAGSNVEFTYFGLFNWAAGAVNRTPTVQDDLFHPFSMFGTAPPLLGVGFDQTDRARQHTINYSSTLDNFELSIRKRFTAPNCRIQYSWLAGVRYVYLLEDFGHFSLGGDGDPAPGFQSRGQLTYDTRTRNSLTGFQVGGDLWANIVPGIRVGGDIKAGVYGNYSNQTTNVVSTDSAGAQTPFAETVDGNDIAMVAEANLTFIYRMNPHWTLRAGYNLLFLEGVALAPENFNSTPPNVLTTGGVFVFPPRASTLNDNGNAFYHGGFAGLEWMW